MKERDRGKELPRGGGEEGEGRALTRMVGVLEARGGWCFQARHVRGVGNRLADGLTRWQVRQNPEKSKRTMSRNRLVGAGVGTEEQLMRSEILRGYTIRSESGDVGELEVFRRKGAGCGKTWGRWSW